MFKTKGQRIIDNVYAQMVKQQEQLKKGISLVRQEQKETLSESYRLSELANVMNNVAKEAEDSLLSVQSTLPKRLVK